MKNRYILLATMSAWACAGQGDTDRVSFPGDYVRLLRQQGETLFNERSGVTTVYVNEVAASAAKSRTLPFPEGAMIVMEFAKPVKNAAGEPMRDERGALLRGDIEHVDVMKRGPVLDAGDPSRAGHWSFASYGADGKTLVAPGEAVKCAACHSQGAADRDFVFRNRPWS